MFSLNCYDHDGHDEILFNFKVLEISYDVKYLVQRNVITLIIVC